VLTGTIEENPYDVTQGSYPLTDWETRSTVNNRSRAAATR